MSNYRLQKQKAIKELTRLRNILVASNIIYVTEATKELTENSLQEIKNRIETLELKYCL